MALKGKNNFDDMHILLAKYLSKETDVNETAIIETWIAANEDNKRYVDRLQMIWKESKKLEYDKKPDTLKALEKFREKIAIHPRRLVHRVQWLRVAAVVLIIVAVATIIKITNRPGIQPPGLLKLSAGNIMQTDTLPDGSVVQLQPHAELICPASFKIKQRNVELKGDAFFSVVHDANHPFQISVNDVKVTVLGTSFKIVGSSGNTEVVVVTGLVQVTKDERSMKVFPHEKLMVPASGGLWIKQSDTVLKKQLLQKAAQKPPIMMPESKQADSTVDDYSYHRQVMVSIMNDLIKSGLVASRKNIAWAALTDSVLLLNGKLQPEALHQKMKAKYHIVADEGYYYGDVQITGKGYFFDIKDFNQ